MPCKSRSKPNFKNVKKINIFNNKNLNKKLLTQLIDKNRQIDEIFSVDHNNYTLAARCGKTVVKIVNLTNTLIFPTHLIDKNPLSDISILGVDIDPLSPVTDHMSINNKEFRIHVENSYKYVITSDLFISGTPVYNFENSLCSIITQKKEIEGTNQFKYLIASLTQPIKKKISILFFTYFSFISNCC